MADWGREFPALPELCGHLEVGPSDYGSEQANTGPAAAEPRVPPWHADLRAMS
jgi:hypothetical protein